MFRFSGTGRFLEQLKIIVTLLIFANVQTQGHGNDGVKDSSMESATVGRETLRLLNERIGQTSNVRYEVIQTVFNAALDEEGYDPSDLVGLMSASIGFEYQFSCEVIDGSCKCVARKRWRDDRNPPTNIVGHYDSNNGIYRGYVRDYLNTDLVQGLIGPEQDLVEKLDRYRYYLDGEHSKRGEYFLARTIDHVREGTAVIGQEGQVTVISHPWSYLDDERKTGTIEVWFDKDLDFLPVKIRGYRGSRADGNPEWFEGWDVIESRRISGVSMPTEVVVVNSNDLGNSLERSAIYHLKLASAEIGQVDREDLNFNFPTGARVVDLFEGVSFTAAADGSRTAISPLAGNSHEALSDMSEPANSRDFNTFLLVNIAILVFFAFFLIKKFRDPSQGFL